MSGILVIIGIIYVVCKVAKELSSDAACREHARKNGLDFYASSTD